MKSRKNLSLVCSFLFLVNLPAWSEDSPTNPLKTLNLNSGHSFGYALGDLIQHEIQFRLDKPYRLESSSLPHPGPLKKWLDLREIKVKELERDSEFLYKVHLIYQIFPSIRKSETRKIPGFPLWISNGNQRLSFDTPDAALILTPLIPSHIPDAGVTIRPAIKPALVSLTLHWWVFAILIGTLTGTLSYIAWREGLLPFPSSRNSPFASARRELRRWRKIGPTDDNTEYRNALQIVHRAFNEMAGETVFATDLEHFFQTHPNFIPMREKTGIFFTLSQQIFFTHAEKRESADYPIQWLDQLLREYYRIERRSV